jgi:2-oxoglutarate ferredoxin oxidoreductase subunit alpha
MEREVRVETAYLDDAETVIVAFGTPSKFVRYAIGRLREAGHKIGMVRPITLWPFPYDTVREAAANARVVGSFELCAGQMIDDVRIGVAGQAPVEFIGGVSTDGSGFGVGRLLDVDVIEERILALHTGKPLGVIPGTDVFQYELAPHQEAATP